jgi:hypothetical protein
MFDVSGSGDDFTDLMAMMFHLFDVTPLTDPAYILAAGTPSGDAFTDLLAAMFIIFA